MQLCLATKLEKLKPLPGDERITLPTIASTHAITINTTAAQVWPWIVQIGQDRGGFYSYTFLENMFGCSMKNADRIYPQWQALSVSDPVLIHPRMKPLEVCQIETDSYLVLGQSNRSFAWTWVFALFPKADTECRLLVRSRLQSQRFVTSLVLYPVMTTGHYFMERKMLVGIKQRSEQL